MHPLIAFCIFAIASWAVWSLLRAAKGQPSVLNWQARIALLVGIVFAVAAWNESQRDQTLGVAEFGIIGGVLILFAVVLKFFGLLVAAFCNKTKQNSKSIG